MMKKPTKIPVFPGPQHYELVRSKELLGLDNVLTVLENLITEDDDLGLYEQVELFHRVLREILEANREQTDIQ